MLGLRRKTQVLIRRIQKLSVVQLTQSASMHFHHCICHLTYISFFSFATGLNFHNACNVLIHFFVA